MLASGIGQNGKQTVNIIVRHGYDYLVLTQDKGIVAILDNYIETLQRYGQVSSGLYFLPFIFDVDENKYYFLFFIKKW